MHVKSAIGCNHISDCRNRPTGSECCFKYVFSCTMFSEDSWPLFDSSAQLVCNHQSSISIRDQVATRVRLGSR
jgi:hypothetical protein